MLDEITDHFADMGKSRPSAAELSVSRVRKAFYFDRHKLLS